MNEQKLIILTGGAGFIGTSVVRNLNENNFKNIIIVDNLGSTEKWKNLVGHQFLDIIGKEQIFSWLEGKESLIQAFIHLGACSSTVETNADYLLNNNYRFSVQLAEYAQKNNHRFIYASSAATYGDGSFGFNDREENLEQLHPLNMYGFSKHLFDLWVKKRGLFDRFVGLKYFNVFGPHEAHKGRMASAIHHLYPLIKSSGSVRLFKSNCPEQFSDGEQKRDFIYVKDAAKMTTAFLNNEKGGIFNIGSGVASSWNALAKAMFKALDLPVKIEYIDMPKDLSGKYQNYTCANMQKTKAVLKDAADCFSLEDSVSDYINNYLNLQK